MDARAGVGDVEVAEGEAECQDGAENEVLGARAGRANVGRGLGSDYGIRGSMSGEAPRSAYTEYRGAHSKGAHGSGREHGSERLVQRARRSMAAR